MWPGRRNFPLFLLPLVFLVEPPFIFVFDKINATPWTRPTVEARAAEALAGAAVAGALLLWRLTKRRSSV